MSVPENNSWDWKGFLQDEQQGCRNTSCKPQHMQQRWYLRELIWWEAICRAGVGVSDSRRQGISTPPVPHVGEMCFAAKLCSFKQEIMYTLFRIFKKVMKMCLVLFFSVFDLSDGSKVAFAIIRSALKSMHTWKCPKGHNTAPVSSEQRCTWPRYQSCASSQSYVGQVEPQQGPHWSNPCSSLSRAQEYTDSHSYRHSWVWTRHWFSRQVCSSLNSFSLSFEKTGHNPTFAKMNTVKHINTAIFSNYVLTL